MMCGGGGTGRGELALYIWQFLPCQGPVGEIQGPHTRHIRQSDNITTLSIGIWVESISAIESNGIIERNCYVYSTQILG